MGQFEHVMVLLSIVVGLGIGHILVGVGGIVDRLSGHGAPIKLSLTHAAWLGYVLVWLALFWWWEYRLCEFRKICTPLFRKIWHQGSPRLT